MLRPKVKIKLFFEVLEELEKTMAQVNLLGYYGR